MKKSKGESQRIYWQQWLSSGNKSQTQQQQPNNGGYSRRELITSSAAIRINPDAAKAKDVTQLLRDTLKLSSLENSNSGNEQDVDSLVLVGTLYSLPKDYVQFEHEPPHRLSDNPSAPNSMKSSEPFHIIKTLHPDDNPLATRDKMMAHLQRIQEQALSHSSNISPKVQWYFVPSNAGDPSRSPIPSCIDLDGYCTSMEEEDSSQEDEDDDNHIQGVVRGGGGADETDTRDVDLFYDLDLLLSRCPSVEEPTSTSQEGNGTTSHCKPKHKRMDKRTKELRRYFQMYQVQPSSSGYLLKQSSRDPHVWRRVHCMLTDEHLWYTKRAPYTPLSSSPLYLFNDNLRLGKKHGRISLGRALLLEPNTECKASPLFRVPHSFEVVSSRGTSHIFRAPNRIIQRQWIQALTTKIMESFENSLLDHAELIVVDQTMARNRRFTNVAVKPLYAESLASDPEEPANIANSGSMYLSMIQASVLRLGMDVAAYRELCRQVQASLPAKEPIVACSGAVNGNVSNSAPASRDHSTMNGGGHLPLEETMDAGTLKQVRIAWDTASHLLDRSTHVALEVQQYVHHQKQNQHPYQQSLSHSLETHCRHIDYVLTGQHRAVRAASPQSFSQSNGMGRSVPVVPPSQKSPPPLDLFDLLLSELQGLIRARK